MGCEGGLRNAVQEAKIVSTLQTCSYTVTRRTDWLAIRDSVCSSRLKIAVHDQLTSSLASCSSALRIAVQPPK